MVSASGNGGMVMIMALLLRAGEVEEVGTLPAGEGELRLLFVVFSEFRELVELVELEPGGEETSASGGSHYRTTQSQSCLASCGGT